MKMIRKICFLTCAFLFIAHYLPAQTGSIEGSVIDKKSNESVIGATVLLESLNKGATTDVDGKFRIDGITPGSYQLKISFISYETLELTDVEVVAGKTTEANALLSESVTALNEVVVFSVRRMNSEVAMLQMQKTALTVTVSSSAEQILFENGTAIGNGNQQFYFTKNHTLMKGTYKLKGWVYAGGNLTSIQDANSLTIPAGSASSEDCRHLAFQRF